MKRMVAVVCVLALAGLVRAEEKKADPNGTWKYEVDANGQKFEVKIKLKQDGDKLTGAVVIMDNETKIEDGKYKDGEVSFTAKPEFGGNKITIKYSGKITGDTFKGKRELDRGDGQTNTRDFEAKRVKE
jgi:hypothetical protein